MWSKATIKAQKQIIVKSKIKVKQFKILGFFPTKFFFPQLIQRCILYVFSNQRVKMGILS